MTRRQPPRRGFAFTLMELLAAIAVLSILALIIVEMLSGATRTVGLTQNRMDVEGQVRIVFAIIGNDLAHMLKRSDAECIVTKNPGNDRLFFYSETSGYFDSSVQSYNRSPLTLVGYRVNPSYQLERFAKGLSWDDASGGGTTGGPVFLTYPNSSSATPNADSTLEAKWPDEIPQPPANLTNYQVIGPGIFRMEICFLLAGGGISDLPYLTDPTHVNGLRDVVAVIVTLAAINDADRRIVPAMATLATAFGDSALLSAQTQPQLPGTAWAAKLASGGFAALTGAPPRAVSRIRVYQHFFYLGEN